MTLFEWAVTGFGLVLTPVIALSYLLFRLENRRQQLINLFTRPAFLVGYMGARGYSLDTSRGRYVWNETVLKKLRDQFHEIFDTEFSREYRGAYFLFSLGVATVSTGFVVALLMVNKVWDGPLIAREVSTGVKFALLGGLFWSLWTLIRGYCALNLVPTTFYWITLRYVLAIAIGLLAGQLFAPAVAGAGAFLAASLPLPEVLQFVQSKVAPEAASKEGDSKLNRIQGIDKATRERLEELGITSPQELANCDPLEVLFRSNIPAKVFLDWVNQALLYIYLGDQLGDLRKRGVRGAIDLARLSSFALDKERDHIDTQTLKQQIATTLGVSTVELENLISNLNSDNRVRFIWGIWGAFEEEAGAVIL